MFPRAAFLPSLGAGMALLCQTAQGEICLAPGQSFQCGAAECPVEGGAEFGQQHDVVLATQRVRVRAVDSNLSTETSYAELFAVVVEPNADLLLRAHLDVRYAGFLTGFGAGPVNFGAVEICAVIRDLESNEVIASSVITERLHTGGPGMDGVQAFENLFGPPANRDVPFTGEETGVRLEAGRQYGIGFGAEARARGGILPGVSNYFTANNGVFLNSLSLVTWADPEVAGFEDDDGDGLPNVWETEGMTDCEGTVLLDLPGMGARADHKDLFVEIDWLAGQEPSPIAIEALKDFFAAAPENSGGAQNPDGDEGISLWIDTGSLTDSSGALVGDDLGGGSEIPLADIPDPNGEFIPPLWDAGGFLGFGYDVDLDDDDRVDFWEVKRAHFDLIRTRIFRYAILGKWRNEVGNTYPGGQAELGGDDSISFGTTPGIFMHEFGHNLALDHGGFEDPMNCKPNHVSVMSYTLPFGIPRKATDAQSHDFDIDGDLDPVVLDYSPPRFPGGRGTAPIFSSDEGLDEEELDESRPLDSTDPANTTRYFNPDGNGRSLEMDEDPDWNDDNVNNPADETVEVDVNGSGEVLGCGIAPQTGTSELAGNDDWSAVQLPIVLNGIVQELAQNDNGETPVPETPDPDPETREAIEGVFGTVDLSVAKTADADLVMAGQVLTYEIEVANAGENPALHVVVEDTLPDAVTPVELPDQCTLSEENLLSCDMDVIDEGEARTLTLPVRVSPRLRCGSADTVLLENEVSVRNGDFADTNPGDNTATVVSEALCLRYEYAAKFVCGMRDDSGSLLTAPGRYSTIVNIHNFQNRTLPFFKKLALAFPPEEQAPGEVLPIGIDELAYDEALKADCDDIRRTLFGGELPENFIDGYLVVQSPRKLDVDVFYSAAASAAGTPGTVSTIDVEEVTERDLRTDLVVEKSSEVFQIPLGDQFRFFAVLYTVRIDNEGGVHAENVEVTDDVSLALSGAAAGTLLVPGTPFEIPPGAVLGPIAHDVFPPAAHFTVTIPEIAPDDAVEIRFWTLALIYLSNPQNPANRAELVNRVETSGDGAEMTLIDNEAETLDVLIE